MVFLPPVRGGECYSFEATSIGLSRRRRSVNKTRRVVAVQAFSNSGAAELYVNGKPCGTAKPDAVNVLTWTDIVLEKGENSIVVRNKYGEDRCVWVVQDTTFLFSNP
jgi:hypothetical protein